MQKLYLLILCIFIQTQASKTQNNQSLLSKAETLLGLKEKDDDTIKTDSVKNTKKTVAQTISPETTENSEKVIQKNTGPTNPTVQLLNATDNTLKIQTCSDQNCQNPSTIISSAAPFTNTQFQLTSQDQKYVQVKNQYQGTQSQSQVITLTTPTMAAVQQKTSFMGSNPTNIITFPDLATNTIIVLNTTKYDFSMMLSQQSDTLHSQTQLTCTLAKANQIALPLFTNQNLTLTFLEKRNHIATTVTMPSEPGYHALLEVTAPQATQLGITISVSNTNYQSNNNTYVVLKKIA